MLVAAVIWAFRVMALSRSRFGETRIRTTLVREEEVDHDRRARQAGVPAVRLSAPDCLGDQIGKGQVHFVAASGSIRSCFQPHPLLSVYSLKAKAPASTASASPTMSIPRLDGWATSTRPK